MEEPDTTSTPHTSVPPGHRGKERKPPGKPRHPNLPRSDAKPSKDKPRSSNSQKLGAIEGRVTPSTPRSVSPESKGDDSASSQPQWKKRSKANPSGASGTRESGRNTADTNPPPTESDTPRRRNQGRPDGGTTDASGSKPPRRVKETRPRREDSRVDSEPIHDSVNDVPSPPERAPRQKRRGKFDGKLTTGNAEPLKGEHHVDPNRTKYWVDYTADDLTSKLARDLRTSPYLDCIVCYNPIRPLQPTWSCSPSSPVAPTEGTQEAQYCWVTLHLKCVRSWASKAIVDTRKVYESRGEDKPGEWSCIGCRAKRTIEPAAYRCFCGADVDPKPPRFATPHSCGNTCTRPRSCDHSCPMFCHPGPCPPCQVTRQVPCHCGSKVLSYKCSNISTLDPAAAERISCGNICYKKLSCGKHSCTSVCHPGPCTTCAEREVVRCYCGGVEADVACGAGEPKSCSVDGEKLWVGRFRCEDSCGRFFECGVHKCSKPCHVPDFKPTACPRAPSIATHCPCGKHEICPPEAPFFPPGSNLVRSTCEDSIPTCTSLCLKQHDGCTHACSSPCHTGPCPSCRIKIVRPCRCGATTQDIECYKDQGEVYTEILCDRPCPALRSCGKHQCNRECCPLASLAGVKGKGKRKVEEDLPDEHGWHVCDLICKKPLSCGNHTCEERDHRPPCPPCLRSSFEEIFCHCTRTVLEPPIPCGTKISCTYPCDRPPPLCGHGKHPHMCHEDPDGCPSCSFLTRKPCACGKNVVGNVICSREKVFCGTPCGKLLKCGFHKCDRSCHSDDCGPCNNPCGKPRRLCHPAIHPCADLCHAPSSCQETEPCTATVIITCPCERIRQSVQCGRKLSSPTGGEGSKTLACTNECAIAKRNARLAEALGISSERPDRNRATYRDELVAFARANSKFIPIVEKSFAEFVQADKKTLVLPRMPPDRRKFVQELAAVYRMDTQLVDPEPYRSIQLIRRIDTRIPDPLLSAASAPTLGRLTDLRPRQIPAPAPVPPKPVATSSGPAWGKGWSSVVTRQPQPQPVVSTSLNPVTTTPLVRPITPVLRAQTASPKKAGVPAEPVPKVDLHVPDDWEEDA